MDSVAYQQFADLEEDHFWFRGRRRIFFDLLDRQVGNGNGLDVLEIGCGTGGFLKRLDRYGRTMGLERALDCAALSQQRSGRPTICGDAYAIPLPDSSLDLVCLFDVLEHLPDERRALAEIARVLRPGGTAFFSVPAYQFLYANNDRVTHHCRRYTWRRLASVLRESGLLPRKVTYFNTFLFPVILPAVLLMKLKERVVGLADEQHTNLTVKIPRLLNRVLFAIMSSERFLLERMNFWVGHSLIAIVEKPRS